MMWDVVGDREGETGRAQARENISQSWGVSLVAEAEETHFTEVLIKINFSSISSTREMLQAPNELQSLGCSIRVFFCFQST